MPTFTPSNLPPATMHGDGGAVLPIAPRCTRGFTLIEMTVVVVLLGLISAVALPNFERWFGSTQQRVDGSRIALQVQGLLARAAILNQSVLIGSDNQRELLADGKPALDLPIGWRLKNDEKLTVNGSGYCTPASITFVSGLTPQTTQQVTVQVKDQQCNVSFSVRSGAT